MANQKFATYFLPSFPPPIQAFGGRLQRESIGVENKWIPARARLRGLGRNDGNLCNDLATHHISDVAVSTRALGRLVDAMRGANEQVTWSAVTESVDAPTSFVVADASLDELVGAQQ
jgi:hypothetical protein